MINVALDLNVRSFWIFFLGQIVFKTMGEEEGDPSRFFYHVHTI